MKVEIETRSMHASAVVIKCIYLQGKSRRKLSEYKLTIFLSTRVAFWAIKRCRKVFDNNSWLLKDSQFLKSIGASKIAYLRVIHGFKLRPLWRGSIIKDFFLKNICDSKLSIVYTFYVKQYVLSFSNIWCKINNWGLRCHSSIRIIC